MLACIFGRASETTLRQLQGSEGWKSEKMSTKLGNNSQETYFFYSYLAWLQVEVTTRNLLFMNRCYIHDVLLIRFMRNNFQLSQNKTNLMLSGYKV